MTAKTEPADLRRFLSYEWQDSAAVSHRIFEEMGIPIKPERLVRMCTGAYPDVIADGRLLRRVPAEGNP